MAQTQRTIELGTGLFVLLGFAALGFLTTQLPGSGLQLRSAADTYTVKAKFDDIGGLKVGAPVTMAGVRIGSVQGIGFDGSEYKAVVNLAIDRKFARIPDDSDAAIQTSGLLGANYVGVTAGGSDTFLHAGSEIALTQSALVLENLINKFFSSTASKKDTGNGSDAK
jgi:phospholipid/cholesterol/gamma-HCH transport system substrate-binding protein